MIKQDPVITSYLQDGRRLTLLNSYNNEQLFVHIDYYLDWSRNTIVHCNSRHGIIFLEQPVDFLEQHITDRKRLAYASCTPGLGMRHKQSDYYNYIVYRTETDLFVIRGSHTLLHLKTELGTTYERDRVDLLYTIDDNMQTMHDRARTSAIILARLEAEPQPLRSFPIL